ncbi:hypothetical protein PF008_g26183 [Phytophthora fragariae]|uniref:Uncharacterized protein n=1 Tax=Phytophthora fragariae TaxID=53985 RepID=A0A6G0QIR1_9STRA|nr:hypothetical protein PF008_g26183 [Phytophthora fragariae]
MPLLLATARYWRASSTGQARPLAIRLGPLALVLLRVLEPRRPVHKNAPDGLDDCDVGTVSDGSDVTIVQDDFTSVCFQSPRDCKHIATTRVVARCEKTHLRIASQVSVQTPRPSFRYLAACSLHFLPVRPLRVGVVCTDTQSARGADCQPWTSSMRWPAEMRPLEPDPVHTGGGTAALLVVDGANVFVSGVCPTRH